MTSYSRGDQEKRVCIPATAGQRQRIVFSIGSNDQWGFEGAVLAPGPGAFDHAHVFDCTLAGNGLPKNMPPSLRNKITFHRVCIAAQAGRSNGRRYATYEQLVEMSGVTEPPAYIKMDVEGWEWEVLPALLTAPERMHPRQIAVELHTEMWPPESKVSPPSMSWRLRSLGEVSALMLLLLRHGYLLIDRRDNSVCSWCSEIVLAKICEAGGAIV